MFQHLKLMPYKALRQEYLSDLGKINVICGQNSSGKSTLMEAIASVEKRQLGRELTQNDILQLYKHSSQRMAWRADNAVQGNQRRQLDRTAAEYKAMLEQVSATKEKWFADDAQIFLNQFRIHWKSEAIFFNHYDTPEGEVLDAFKKIFDNGISTVLVPPKRRLELDGVLSLSDAIHNDGQGLLPYLFFAKNQADNTEDRQIYDLIVTAFLSISDGHRFDIFPTQKNTLGLHFSYRNEPWRPAQDCGLGLQDLLVMLYFASTPKYQVVMIEEPESHLHPQWQRKLLAFFHASKDKQFFLTTHSNIFLDAGFVNKVFFTTLNGSIKVDDATGRAAILSELGYAVTDNLVSDLVIFVEGPSDVAVIEQFLIKMKLYSDYNVKIWPLGGDNMGQLDLSVFAEHYTILALVDNDPKSARARKPFIEQCEQLRIPLTRLNRYAMENYFSLNAIREVYRRFGTTVSEAITEIRPNETVESQIGINVKRNNRLIAALMTLEDISGTDLSDFLALVARTLKGE